MAKKTRIEGIDENFIINSFRQDDITIPPAARATDAVTDEAAESSIPEPETTALEEKDEPRRRKPKNKDADYGTLFLQEWERRCIYARSITNGYN